MILLKTPQQEIYFYSFLFSTALFTTLSPIFTESLILPLVYFPALLYNEYTKQVITRKTLASMIYNTKVVDKNLVTDEIKTKVKEFVTSEFDSRINYSENRIGRLEEEIDNVNYEIQKEEEKLSELQETKENVLEQFDEKESETPDTPVETETKSTFSWFYTNDEKTKSE